MVYILNIDVEVIKEFIYPRVIIPLKNKRKEYLLEKKATEKIKLKTNNNIDSLLI